MRNQQVAITSLKSFLLDHSSKMLIGASLLASSIMAEPLLMPAQATERVVGPQVQASVSSALKESGPIATLPDGTYLYGQSPKPEQVGQGYFVFEVNRGSVVGALYMPRSSFDCASGTFQANQLALTVVNSYDRTTNPFEIALETSSNVATSSNPALQKVGLQGFYRLNTISENDQRILNVCKADFQKQAKSN